MGTQAVHDATQLGHAPTEADARLAAGWALATKGDHDAAEQQLRTALHAAETGRHDAGITTAWNRLAWVVGYKGSRFEEGRRLARHAEAWSRRASDPVPHDLVRLRTLGWIEHDAGNAEASLAHFEAGVAAAERLPADDPHRAHELAMVLNGLGAAALAAVDLPRASEAFARSTELMEQTLGPEHPDVAKLRNNLTSLLRAEGKPEEAHRLLQHNLQVFEATYGDAHPLVGQTLINLAVTQLDLGHHRDAETHADRAIALLRAAHGPEHPLVAKGHTVRGDARVQLQRPLEALEDFEHAVALEIAALGPTHPNVGITEANIAAAYYDLGRFEESVEHHERALAILEASLGADHPNLAIPVTSMGLARRDQGRPEEALALFRRAEAIGEASARAAARAHIGGILLDQGKTDEAVALLEEALSGYDEIEHDPGFSGDAHLWLAKALWARGERERARAEARAAIADFEAGDDVESRADAERWLREHPLAGEPGRRP